MKKRFILLAALALAILLAACASSGGKDSSHPYSWKEKNDGSVRLTIRNMPEDGWSWQIDGTGNGLVHVERIDDGTDENAVFSLTGQGFGGGSACFVCRRDTAPFDVSFRLNLMLSVSEKGELTVISAEHTQFPPAGFAGGEGIASCTWYVAEDGSRELYLDGAGETYAWEAMEYDSTRLSLEGPDASDTGYTYRLTGLSAGETKLLLYDLTKDYGFRLTVSVAQDLSVDVTDCEAGSFVIPAAQIPGMEEAALLVGELTLPDDIKVLRCSTESWYGGEEKDCVELLLQADGKNWSLVLTKSYSVEKLIELCYGASDNVTKSEAMLGQLSATVCGTEPEQALFWDGDDGFCYILNPLSDGATRSELLRMAQLLCKAQDQGE